MDYNYIEVNKSFFPTHCLNYPADSKIEVRMLTVGDAKLLAMLDENNATAILNQIVKRCTRLTNLTFDELYLADRDYLLFYIRSGSFVASDNAFKFKIEQCANCGHPATFDIKLDDIQLDEIKSFCENFNILGKNITIRPPRIRDKQYNLKDIELTRLLNYTDIAEVFGSVEAAITNVLQLDAMNYVLLTSKVNNMKCGIREELLVNCPTCGNQINLKWHFEEIDLLGKIDIRGLLRSILGIAKYTHYQITDDMLYAEYQLMEQLTEKMIADENKAYENANGITTFTN